MATYEELSVKVREIRKQRLNTSTNHKNYNFLDLDWFKKLLFSSNSLAKSLSDSLSLDGLSSNSLISQSHSKF